MKISNLPAASSVNGVDLIPIVQGGTTKKAAASLLGGSVPVGNTVFVDAVNGNDGTGTRGRQDKPFLTLAAAKTAASSGDLIIVGPGTYTEGNLLKNGVNWYFDEGSIVYSHDPETQDSVSIFTDTDGAITSTILGRGIFIGRGTNTSVSTVLVGNAASNITIEAKRIATEGVCDPYVAFPNAAIRHSGGKLTVRADKIDTNMPSPLTVEDLNKGSIAVLWSNGELIINCLVIEGHMGAVYSIAGAPSTTQHNLQVGSTWITGAMSVTAEYLRSVFQTVWTEGTTNARVWVTAKEIYSEQNALGMFGNRGYVTAEKIASGSVVILAYGGQSWISAQKIASQDTTLAEPPPYAILICHAGTAFIDFQSIEDLDNRADLGVFSNHADSNLTISGHVLKLGNLGVAGVKVSAGTVVFKDSKIDSSASATANPVLKSGGTLILQNVVLIAESTQDSITAADAQNVKVYGTSVANTAKNSNVTIQVGTLTVSADVQ